MPSAPAQKLIDEKKRALEAAPAPGFAPALPTGATPDPAAAAAALSMEGGADDIYGGESGTSTSSSAAQMHRTSEAAQMRAMRLQQELLLREAEECTFHPRINSRQGSTIKVANPEAFFNRTQQWKEQIAHDNEDRRKKIEEKALVECTFAPNVLPSPRRMSSGSARGSTSQAAAVAPSHRAPASAREVTSRLYQPQARIAQSEELDRKRDERRQQEEAECSFHPSVNKPLRTNVATNVASRYRRGASPAKRLPPPTGEEQCTFSPAVNRTPRALSHAVAEYLDDPAHLRLSRPPPREAPASAGRGLMRSASAPRFGDADPPSPGGTSDKGDEVATDISPSRRPSSLQSWTMPSDEYSSLVREQLDALGYNSASIPDTVLREFLHDFGPWDIADEGEEEMAPPLSYPSALATAEAAGMPALTRAPAPVPVPVPAPVPVSAKASSAKATSLKAAPYKTPLW